MPDRRGSALNRRIWRFALIQLAAVCAAPAEPLSEAAVLGRPVRAHRRQPALLRPRPSQPFRSCWHEGTDDVKTSTTFAWRTLSSTEIDLFTPSLIAVATPLSH